MKRLLLALLLLGLAAPARAQQPEAPVGYPREAAALRSVFHTLNVLLQEAALGRGADHLGARLDAMRLDLLMLSASPLAFAPALSAEAPAADAAALAARLRAAAALLEAAAADLSDEAQQARLEAVAAELGAALEIADALAAADAPPPEPEDAFPELEAPAWAPADSAGRGRLGRRLRERGRHAAFVGGGEGWPYRSRVAVETPPAWRYNRVEGLTLGIGLDPLGFGELDRFEVVGQLSYALALEKVRYTAGAEMLLTPTDLTARGLKVGGNYHRNTATHDQWKTSWTENGLAAVLFGNDFFDYYEVQGWTLYGVGRLSPAAHLSLAYRSDDYRNLRKTTTWSLFGGSGFRANPLIDEGRLRSVVAAFEGGRVEDFSYLPRGAALRAEVEAGEGLGGVGSFTRTEVDGRAYLPLSARSSFGLRLRGGAVSGDAPYQKGFTLGGVGSVRGLPQNAFYGTRMLLGNAEFSYSGITPFGHDDDDLQLILFADAGWVNSRVSNRFDADHLLPSAGFGLGFDDRGSRLELAFPLKDVGAGYAPSLWLRIYPAF